MARSGEQTNLETHSETRTQSQAQNMFEQNLKGVTNKRWSCLTTLLKK